MNIFEQTVPFRDISRHTELKSAPVINSYFISNSRENKTNNRNILGILKDRVQGKKQTAGNTDNFATKLLTGNCDKYATE